MRFKASPNPKILHLCISEKFISPLIRLLNDNFDPADHHFVITKPKKQDDYSFSNASVHKSFFSKLHLTFEIYRADKVILHGLYDSHFLYFISIQPWLLKKCYWVIWGSDLYQYLLPRSTLKSRIKEFFRAKFVRQVGHLVTYIDGDYQNAVKWYGARGKKHECLGYLSNTFNLPNLQVSPDKGQTNIQIGNSAFQRNNHFLALDALKAFKDQDIQIFCPLSYGPKEYAKQVCDYGFQLFGRKFVPLLDFMPIVEYTKLQSEIDIGIFAQNNQQAMGNMIQLLGLGKKLYLLEQTTPWELFTSLGLHIYNLNDFSLEPMTSEESRRNSEIILKSFSSNRLVEQYREIFSH